VDSRGRTIWIADTHRDDGKRFVVRADEKLTAFLELEWAIRGLNVSLCLGAGFCFDNLSQRPKITESQSAPVSLPQATERQRITDQPS
jgi:hypothetical protein